MTELEEAVRARFRRLEEPDLQPSPDLLRTVRKVRRRQDMRIPGIVVGAGLVAAAAVASVAGSPRSSTRDLVVSSSPTPTPSATSDVGCASSREDLTTFIREIVAFQWPSGSKVATIQPGPRSDSNACVVALVGLQTAVLTDADVQAAAERWGSRVRLEVSKATVVPDPIPSG
ncbi:MAG: hypothetical protein JWM40_1027 [Frankiales bacterium]|nr:hypothetical protein [Frankiales bacterium]